MRERRGCPAASGRFAQAAARRLHADTAGETLVEALCAIAVLTLTVLFFFNAVSTSNQINLKAGSDDDATRAAISRAEAGPWNKAGTVTVDGEEIDVYFDADADDESTPTLVSYRLERSAE